MIMMLDQQAYDSSTVVLIQEQEDLQKKISDSSTRGSRADHTMIFMERKELKLQLNDYRPTSIWGAWGEEESG